MHPLFPRFRSLLISSTLAATLIVGCKGSGSDPAPATTTDLAGNYKITAYTRSDGKQTLDYAQILAFYNNTCFQDLVIVLKADGTFSSNNPTSCSTAADAVDEFKGGKWSTSGTTFSLTPTNQSKSDWTYAMSGKKLTLTQTTTISGTSVNDKTEWTKQ